MLTYGYFNSINGDREYSADQMNDNIRGLVNNGIVANYLQSFAVSFKQDLTVTVSQGKAYINGVWVNNDEIEEISLSTGQTTVRYDFVILKLNSDNRCIELITDSSDTPDRETAENELVLAMVKIPVGATVISQSYVTDKRKFTSLRVPYEIPDKTISKEKLADETLNLINSKISTENAEKLENKITSFDITFADESNTKYPTINAVVKYLSDYFYNVDEMYANFLSTDAKIGTKNLENKSVTMEKLAQAVLDLIDGKISNNAGAIGTDNLASSSVTTDKLANNAVTNKKIANGAISFEKISSAYVDNAPSISAPFYGECLVKSGGVYNALKTKYDSSNIETGTGNFGIYAGATPGKSGTFTYQKIGDVVTVSCNLVMSAGQGCHFTGLPFKTAAQSIVMTRTISTNTRCSVNANGTWISVQTNGTTFTDDDNVQITFSYSI